MACCPRVGEIVRDQQHRSAASRGRRQRCLEAGKSVAVQAHSGFVQGYDGWLTRKHSGQGKKPLTRSGQVVGMG